MDHQYLDIIDVFTILRMIRALITLDSPSHQR